MASEDDIAMIDAVQDAGHVADDGDTDEDTDPVEVPQLVSGFVKMRPSAFRRIPATIFVDYPCDLLIRRDDVGEIVALGNRKLVFRSHWERICIRNAFHRAGFTKSTEGGTTLVAYYHIGDEPDNLLFVAIVA